MNTPRPDQQGSESAAGAAESKGLTAEHKTALSEAIALRSSGESSEAATAHLVASGMPKVVAKVLLRQYDRTSETALLRNAATNR